MREFLNFVRDLPGVQEMEERVAEQLDSAFALTVGPRREWVLACWLEDLRLERRWPRSRGPRPNPYRLLDLGDWWINSGPVLGKDTLGNVGWEVLRDTSLRAAIAEWLESRLDFPNLDYNRTPPGFKNKAEGLLMRIVFPRYPKPTSDEMSRAREIVANSPVPCVIEFRAKPRLALGPGTELDPSGTAGGLVRDGVGRVYAVTCGHVVAPLLGADARDRRVRSRSGELLGEVVQAAVPVRSPPGHICARPRPLPNQPPAAPDPYANQLDAALIHLSEGPPTTGLRDAFSNFDKGTRVRMVGAKSGTADYAVGDVNLWTKFPSEHQHEPHICFQDLFNIEPLSESWLWRTIQFLHGPRVANLATATVPQRGDSGAWLTSPAIHGAQDWLGMLVGVNDSAGYAVMSDVVRWWISQVLPGPVAVH